MNFADQKTVLRKKKGSTKKSDCVKKRFFFLKFLESRLGLPFEKVEKAQNVFKRTATQFTFMRRLHSLCTGTKKKNAAFKSKVRQSINVILTWNAPALPAPAST